jgi:hypothetical protein
MSKELLVETLAVETLEMIDFKLDVEIDDDS